MTPPAPPRTAGAAVVTVVSSAGTTTSCAARRATGQVARTLALLQVVVVVATGADLGRAAALCRIGARWACDPIVAQDADSAISTEAAVARRERRPRTSRHRFGLTPTAPACRVLQLCDQATGYEDAPTPDWGCPPLEPERTKTHPQGVACCPLCGSALSISQEPDS
jgi:hypothetical protein